MLTDMAARTQLRSSVQATIISERHDSWQLAPEGYAGPHAKHVTIDLEIEGDAKDGFQLIMTPTGCFTADCWFESEEEALRAAEEIYGASRGAWTR